MAIQDDIARRAQEQEQLAMKQFAARRRRLGAQTGEAQRQSRRGFERLSALTGGRTGGAVQKAQQQSIRDILRERGLQESEISGQEASALQRIKELQGAQEFAREERVGSEAFQAGESEKARALQEKLFGEELGFKREQFEQQHQLAKDSLQFQRDSWAEQMSFNWAEFDENKKAQVINSAMALKEAGLGSVGDWNAIAGVLEGLFGTMRVPGRFRTSEAERIRQLEQERRDRNIERGLSMGGGGV